MLELKFNNLTKINKEGIKGYSIWAFDKKGVVSIYRNGLLEFLKENGFYKKQLPNKSYLFYRKDAHIITAYTHTEIREFVVKYIEENNLRYKINYGSSNTLVTLEQLKEILLRNIDAVFHPNFLGSMDILPFEIVRDKINESYVPFRNVVIKITADSIEEVSYTDLGEKVFYSTQIIQHDFEYTEKWKCSIFGDYIKNITNDTKERKNAFRSAMGYLLHRHNDVSNAQAIILYDEVMSGRNIPEGGTGKGLFAQAIRQVVKGFVQINGKNAKLTSQFAFQQIKEDTDVVFIDDVSTNFDIDGLNSVLSEGINVEKKFRDIIELPKEETPKFIVSSNHILSYEGSTRERRQYILQFSSFYKDKYREGNLKPIISEHKSRFFTEDWDTSEWNKFFSFMMNCIKFYLIHGLVKTPRLNFKKNAFIQKYGIDMYLYFEQLSFTSTQEYSTKEMYKEYVDDDKSPEIQQRGFTNALKSYLQDNNMECKLMKKGILKILS
ncbi:hypothetical protein LZQ00_06465 [Sphingobacterium sp. SRCM116780]|uniref:primase-helicase family protein n=1 Tax=Sphingobacterium sp. SRCM116780 TaxID=2907623 RepID=UPI001F203F4A|nr:primase-helicase family protein [Sphingobacterium sp. SRCM116780]UIR57457.1 hypothetical protein LZQ00_06465 [Sphingobacterium sp. SRCM116780]